MRKLVVMIPVCLVAFCWSMAALALGPSSDELATATAWTHARFGTSAPVIPGPGLLIKDNHDPVIKNSRFGKPLTIGDTAFSQGLYCHAHSEIVVTLPSAGKAFEAQAGVDNNDNTSSGSGSVIFVVNVNGEEKFRSGLMRGKQAPVPVRVDLDGATAFTLIVEDGGDGIGCDQADWANAQVTLANGEVIAIADLPMAQSGAVLNPGIPPFSFVYNGAGSSEYLAKCRLTRNEASLDNGKTRTTFVYTPSEPGLEVRCEQVRYTDYPMVEWTLYFKNTGTQDTAILENVQALDIPLTRSDRDEFLLHHFVGSPCQINDYEPLETALTPGMTKRIASANGRATSSDMCFFNLETSWGNGLIIGLGWPGQWAAEFKRDDAHGLQITAGQEGVHLKLHPGEEIRTPLVALQFWQGDWVRAQNIWRRWMVAHNMPRPGGKRVEPFVTADSSAQFGEMIGASETSQKYFIDRYLEERLGIDYWWMDAGWYPCDGSWPKTGTWEVDTKRFPNGLRAVSDHAHAKGLDIIVWFEPERVQGGTWLTEQHPDWILGGANGGLLNLGNEDACNWLIDHVDRLMNDQGIDLYRQDFNCDPLEAWRANDAKESPAGERQGITENKHIVGLFRYWDTLIQRRNGNLLIDTCASGGRRNDLETLRRAVPLWRTDFPFNPTATQCHTYGISFWIPLSGTGVKVIDDYDFRSNAAPEFTCHWDVREKDINYDLCRKQLAEWRQYAPNFMGDFYPLTGYSTQDDDWMVWQFDRPEEGKGMVQAFRRAGSVYTAAAFPLRGLEPKAQYRVTNIDAPQDAIVMNGQVLMDEGFNVTMPKRPSACVWLYEKL